MEERHELQDSGHDILSHPVRKNTIHILTLDPTLASDVYKRIHRDPRTKRYRLVRPHETNIRYAVEEIEAMAKDTVSSRLIIMDVRRATLPKLRRAYNKIIGYNRRDLNKLCYTILIGDGPVNLFQAGKTLDVFIPHLSDHRVDYHPAVFFYDPFIHYEPDEIQHLGIDHGFTIADTIPRRLVQYFKESQDLKVDSIRRFFRATGKSDDVRKERLKTLRSLYKKRIAEQFPHHRDLLKAWLSKEGVRLATERMHLYPLFFEDWVHDLMQKARQARH